MNEAPLKLRAPAVSHADEPEFDLRNLTAILRRRFRTLTLTALGVMAIVLLVVFQLERQYTATALVVVDSRESQLLGFEPAFSEAFGLNPAVDTEVEIARSASVLSRVGQDLQPALFEEFLLQPSIVDVVLLILRLAERPDAAIPANWGELSSTDRAKMLEQLSKRFEIERLGLTKVISVSAVADSPDTASELANALTNAYLEEQIEGRLDASQRAVSFLRERVNKLASEISAQEDELEQFIEHTLAEYGTEESQDLLRRLERERVGQVENISTLAGIEAALQANDLDRVSRLLNAAEEGFDERRERLTELARAGEVNEEGLEAVQEDLATLDQDIRAAAERRVTELRTVISSSEQDTTDLRAQLDSILARQEIPRDVSVELFRLQRDSETKRNLYSSFLAKLRQAEQQSVFDLPDSRVIAPATPPAEHSFPPERMIGGAAIILSIFAGLGMALVRDWYIGGFTSNDQLETIAGVPVIASVSRYRPKHGNTAASAIVSEPLSSFAEAVRRARLGVEALGQGGQLCVLVTSTLPKEGKTTIALALARAFAMTRKKTLLIDADLRHPAVDKLVGRSSSQHLQQYLTGESELDDVGQLVTAPEAETGLSFIYGDGGFAGATDVLLASDRFRGVMSFARSNFDIVVIDTSPIGLVVDPQIIAREADVCLYVVRYASTSQTALRTSLKQLRSESKVVCAVLNQVEREAEIGDGYGYYGKP